MNQTSPAATGTTGAVIAALVVIISAISTHFKIDLSAQDQVSIAGGIVVGVHWLALQLAAHGVSKVSPATPAAPPAVAQTPVAPAQPAAPAAPQ